jgi:hypothetical protein
MGARCGSGGTTGLEAAASSRDLHRAGTASAHPPGHQRSNRLPSPGVFPEALASYRGPTSGSPPRGRSTGTRPAKGPGRGPAVTLTNLHVPHHHPTTSGGRSTPWRPASRRAPCPRWSRCRLQHRLPLLPEGAYGTPSLGVRESSGARRRLPFALCLLDESRCASAQPGERCGRRRPRVLRRQASGHGYRGGRRG